MLLLAVDDATGKVASAMFCEYETTQDYLRHLTQIKTIPTQSDCFQGTSNSQAHALWSSGSSIPLSILHPE